MYVVGIVIVTVSVIGSIVAGSLHTDSATAQDQILSVDVIITNPTAIPTPTTTPTSTLTPTPTATPSLTPTPTIIPPTPTPIAYTSNDLEKWFSQYARENSIDRELLKRIALCESGFRADATSAAGYGGMFQFHAQTWVSTRRAMGQDENVDLRFNAEESIKTAAFKISRGGIGAWPECS